MATVESLTEGLWETLEWMVGAMDMSCNPSQDATISQVANAQYQYHNRPLTAAEGTQLEAAGTSPPQGVVEPFEGAWGVALPPLWVNWVNTSQRQ